jgi:hypothetical protein
MPSLWFPQSHWGVVGVESQEVAGGTNITCGGHRGVWGTWGGGIGGVGRGGGTSVGWGEGGDIGGVGISSELL